MYGYIYKFTFIPTSEWYIGQHKYEGHTTLDENYWGSGKKWVELITNYNKSEWKTLIKREIIEWCESEDQLNEREIYWIEALHARENGLNIAFGGSSWRHPHTDETKQLLSNLAKLGITGVKGKQLSETAKQNHSKSTKRYYDKTPVAYIHKGDISKRVPISELDFYYAQGWEPKRGPTHQKAWNKGLTAETDDRMKAIVEKRTETMMNTYGTMNIYEVKQIKNGDKFKC